MTERERDLGAAIATATATPRGDERPLFDLLMRASRLPGPAPNLDLVKDFGEACAARGPAVDRLVVRMATLDADLAPGDTAAEILPMCGVAAAGARATRAARAEPRDERALALMLAALHDAAEDLRFRVRALVPSALAGVGAALGPDLLDRLSAGGWLEGYFHAAAVLLALGDSTSAWAPSLPDAAPVLDVVDTAYALARDAPRSASRYPGFKALLDALGAVPAQLTVRYGAVVLDRLAAWAVSQDPAMRALVEANLRAPRLRGRFSSAEIDRVGAALRGSAKAPRDPTQIVQGTRGRGKKRRAR